ncbi:MAG: FkbM family methyltransferase, partial [Rhizobiales bacterium]|nr:FkbM family methyltransferase [Hyphomicrobiales bacterium]
VAGAEDGKSITFHVSNGDGRSSSYMDMGRLKEIRPSIKYVSAFEARTERLDRIVNERYAGHGFNVLAIDVQGADLDVLNGSETILDRIDAVFVEVSIEPIYVGGCTFLEIYGFLAAKGFLIRDVQLVRDGWGNAFFSRPKTALHRLSAENLARGKEARQSSVYYDFNAARGIDNVLTGPFNVHTRLNDTAAWWQVDLGEMTSITRILFLDRADHELKSASMQIQLSRDGEEFWTIHARKNPPSTLVDVHWKGDARYVRLQLAEPGPLHFRQVIVV